MIFKHTSVLLTETIENLNINPVGIYIDGTLGGGGHAEEICKRLAPEGILIGIDRDKDALNAARIRLETYKCKKYFIQNNYSQVKDVISDIGIAAVDGAILDLGVSSFQLDNENRGFSYMKDAPLDMRMNGEDLFSAYDVINEYKEQELARIIKKYGEERWATRIAKFIVAERKEKNITTTGELVEIIKKAIPASARREGPHPAKRTFQAIRIEVNDELGQLEKAVYEFCDVLEEKGRLCIITFHSLEDRIVKKAFNERVNPCKCPPELPMCVCGEKADIRKITKKPITPTYLELEENPRSRSAKLRVVEKRGKENDDYGEKG